MTSRSRRSPADRLGHPDLSPLVDELARRYSSGHDPVRVTLPDLGDAGRRHLADLLGVDRLPAPGSTLPVTRLAAALGVEATDGLRAIVTQLRGPLGDRRAERAASTAAKAELWDHVEASAIHLRIFAEPDAASAWVHRMAALGVPGGDVDAHRERLDLALACLRLLPADLPVSLAGLAADVTGSAHGLDPGRRLNRAVLDGLALAFGVPSPHDAEAARSLWEQAGVVPDPLSSTVLTLGLRPIGDDPLSTFLRAVADDAEPVVLTLRQLQRWPETVRFDLPAAYVVENPSLLAEAAARPLGSPLLCSSGRPSLAVVSLVRRLVSEGSLVHQHSDFDPAGLEITRWLAERAGTTPWRMFADDYRAALAAGRPTTGLHGAVGATPWDPSLAETMRVEGRAVHEEALRDDLLSSIWADG